VLSTGTFFLYLSVCIIDRLLALLCMACYGCYLYLSSIAVHSISAHATQWPQAPCEKCEPRAQAGGRPRPRAGDARGPLLCARWGALADSSLKKREETQYTDAMKLVMR
jgi:hypothetical protein